MKKRFILITFCIYLLVPLAAQKSKDVVYLRNGSRIYGKLLEATDQHYKIETADGSIFIYSLPEVEKIVNEVVPFSGRKKNGLGFGLEAGFLVGSQDKAYRAPFSFNCLADYIVKTRHSIGLGSGVEYIGKPFAPLYLEYKYCIHDRKASPFFFTRAGKLFCLGSDQNTNGNDYGPRDFSGGFTFTLGTGISWSKEDIETTLSFAYRYAETSYIQKSYVNYDATYKNEYNRLEVKLGFRF